MCACANQVATRNSIVKRKQPFGGGNTKPLSLAMKGNGYESHLSYKVPTSSGRISNGANRKRQNHDSVRLNNQWSNPPHHLRL
jgi:hypothetical protein